MRRAFARRKPQEMARSQSAEGVVGEPNNEPALKSNGSQASSQSEGAKDPQAQRQNGLRTSTERGSLEKKPMLRGAGEPPSSTQHPQVPGVASLAPNQQDWDIW